MFQEMVEFLVDIWDQEGLYDWQNPFSDVFFFTSIFCEFDLLNQGFISMYSFKSVVFGKLEAELIHE